MPPAAGISTCAGSTYRLQVAQAPSPPAKVLQRVTHRLSSCQETLTHSLLHVCRTAADSPQHLLMHVDCRLFCCTCTDGCAQTSPCLRSRDADAVGGEVSRHQLRIQCSEVTLAWLEQLLAGQHHELAVRAPGQLQQDNVRLCRLTHLGPPPQHPYSNALSAELDHTSPWDCWPAACRAGCFELFRC